MTLSSVTIYDMDASGQPLELRTMVDTISLSLSTYSITMPTADSGLNNLSISISPKGIDHSSPHQADNHPTVYYNLGYGILNADIAYPTPSQTESSLYLQKYGNVIVYDKYDFFELLTDVPYLAENYPHQTMRAVVFSPFNNTVSTVRSYYL